MRMIQCAMDTDPVEFWLHELRLADAERFALVERLRRIVLLVDRRIREEIKYGGILFSAGSPFCGLFSYAQHISLEFSRGAELPDKHHVLEGQGKKRRHIKITVGNDLFKKNVGEYVALASGMAFAAASKTRGGCAGSGANAGVR